MSDDLGSKKFSNGKRAGKTYLEVLQTDEEFCKMALSGARTPFIPDDFREYVLTSEFRDITLSTENEIKERKCADFVKAFTPEMREKFKTLLGDTHPEIRTVHSQSKVFPNSNLGVFYRMFVKKCVFNVTNTDGYCKFIDSYAAIFPFLVSEKLPACDAEILNFLDEKLLDEMQSFFNDHFDNIEIRSISNKFFSNILTFKRKNFSEKTLFKTLKNIKGLALRNDGNLIDNHNEFRRLDGHEPEDRSDYLKNFPRLNRAGAYQYRHIYDMYRRVVNLYQKPCVISANKYRKEFLTKLPEINLYELYSLLDPKFLRYERREYIYRFQKYVFFFVNALKSDSKPVFFIDDVLFECLKSLKTFRKSRDDVLDLKYELSIMTLVHRRKQLLVDHNDLQVDDENLRLVKEYVEKFIPEISSAIVDYEISTDILESSIAISTNDTFIRVNYRKKRKSFKQFCKSILLAALCPKNIKRLVMYNAFRGEESSIAMPENKQELVDFIRAYNKYDFSETLPPEAFIYWKQEQFYQGDVSKWDPSVYKLF